MKSYEDEFTASIINRLARDIYAWAQLKGFWQGPEAFSTLGQAEQFAAMQKSQKIALMHSELSELLEEIRKPSEDDTPGFSNEEVEIADLIIRALDYAGRYGLRIGEAISAKMAKNEGRPYMHGKAF